MANMSDGLSEYQRRMARSPIGLLVDDVRAFAFFCRMVRAHSRHGGGFVSGCAFCDMRMGGR